MFFEMKRVYKEVRNNISKEPRAAKTAIEVEDQCTKDMRDFSWLFSCKSYELVLGTYLCCMYDIQMLPYLFSFTFTYLCCQFFVSSFLLFDYHCL